MLDLDHFKSINDNFDHAMGDAVLRGVGSLLRNTIRSIDIAGRYGGEELCVVLPGTDGPGALGLAEKLRRDLAAMIFDDSGRRVQITASFGVATLSPGHPRTSDQLLRAADCALYKAKQQGRNRVLAEGVSDRE
jgi:diguanylate cyclase (GGDEF)-like protein